MSYNHFYKFEITSDTAFRIYYKSASNSYDFWIAMDGERIFLDNGFIHKLSEEEEQDLLYGGTMGENIALKGFCEAPS